VVADKCQPSSTIRPGTPHRVTDTIRYDTIRDDILTCAQKPTRVSLIYRTGPTTKKWKNRKTEKKIRICSEVSVNIWRIRGVGPEEEREGYGEKDLQKRKVVSLEWKSEGVM